MLLRWTIVFVCLWIFSLETVYGYCFKDPIKFERTVSGRVRKYCEYKHPPVVNKDAGYIIMFPDSSVFTGDCLACTCTMDGLTCCGFGHQEINSNLPADCIQLQDGCHGLHVKKHNNSLDCITGKPITIDTLAPHPDNIFSLPSLVLSGSTKVIKMKGTSLNKKESSKTLTQDSKINTRDQSKPPTVIESKPREKQQKQQSSSNKQKTVIRPVQQITNTTTVKQKSIVTTPKPETTVSIIKPETKPAPSSPVKDIKKELKPPLTINLGNIPITARPQSNLNLNSNRMIIPLNLPVSGKQQSVPILPLPKPEQIKPLPIQEISKSFPQGFTPNILIPNRVSQTIPNLGFRTVQNQVNQWQGPSVDPFATDSPPFYPVPYMDPSRDPREDSSSGTYLNDFLFRAMLFGAFS